MKPIADIINKIKWDERENPEDYTIGYEDRILKKIIEVRFADIKRIDEGFMIIDKEVKGRIEEASIPLHRARVVKKKGEIVWKRPSQVAQDIR